MTGKSCRGRRDITQEAFSNGQPIEFNLGAPIRQLTGVVSSPDALPIVEHHTAGTRLLVDPGLIGRRQDLRFTVMTDREPVGTLANPLLIDTQARQTILAPRARWEVCSVLVIAAYVVAAVTAGPVVLDFPGIKGLAVQAVALVIGFVPLGIWILYRGYRPVPLK